MPLKHLSYTETGRKFDVTKDGKPAGQKVYKGGLGQVNVLDQGVFKPYVWDQARQICKFNNYEIRLVAAGVEIWEGSTKLIGLGAHPEIEKELTADEFDRKAPAVSGLTSRIITNQESADRIEISYNVETDDISTRISFEMGGRREITFGCELTAKVLDKKQRLTLEFDQESTLSELGLPDWPHPLQKYIFKDGKTYWKWLPSENAEHKATVTKDKTEVHLKEQVYTSLEPVRIKPDTFGPQNVGDAGMEYGGTWMDDSSGNITMGSYSSSDTDAAWTFTVTDADLPGATINSGTKIVLTGGTVGGSGCSNNLKICDSRDVGTWAQGNLPSDQTKHPDNHDWDESSGSEYDSSDVGDNTQNLVQARIDGDDVADAHQSGDKMSFVSENVDSGTDNYVYWPEETADLTIEYTPAASSSSSSTSASVSSSSSSESTSVSSSSSSESESVSSSSSSISASVSSSSSSESTSVSSSSSSESESVSSSSSSESESVSSSSESESVSSSSSESTSVSESISVSSSSSSESTSESISSSSSSESESISSSSSSESVSTSFSSSSESISVSSSSSSESASVSSSSSSESTSVSSSSSSESISISSSSSSESTSVSSSSESESISSSSSSESESVSASSSSESESSQSGSVSVSSSSESASVSTSVSSSSSSESTSTSASESTSVSSTSESESESISVSSSSESESVSSSGSESASSESVSTSASASSSSLTPASWLAGWDNRIKITLDKDQIDATLSNFPVPIYLSTSSGQTNADVSFVFDELGSDANRKKIAVTRSDGTTECYVEIERWDDTNEKAWLHTKVHSISSIQDGYLYLYYDSDHADNDAHVGDVTSTPGQAVWDDNFALVCHMGEDPSTTTIKDSTQYENHGTSQGSMTSEDLIDGQFGKCLDFDGEGGNDADGIEFAALDHLEDMSRKTVEAVVDFAGNATSFQSVLCKVNWRLEFTAADKLQFKHEAADTDGRWYVDYTPGSFQHVAASYDKSSSTKVPAIYVDGAAQEHLLAVQPVGAITSDNNLLVSVGALPGAYPNPYEGKIDEVRISDTIRTAAWVKATYKGLFDDLLVFSAEESSVSVSSSFSSESSSSESVSASSESVSPSSSSSGSASASSESISASSSSSGSVSSSSVSTSASSSSSESTSALSVSVSASSSSLSYDPTVYATVMSLEITPHTPGYAGIVDALTTSLEFTTKTVTYPLYGRMGQPIITGSKPKVICEGAKAYVDCEARSAKILISGY